MLAVYTHQEVGEAIKRVDPETPPSQVKLVEDMIDTSADGTRRRYIEDSNSRLAAATQRVAEGKDKLSDLRRDFEDVAARFAKTLGASAIRAALYVIGALACFVSETNLSLSIPFVMNVIPQSFSGLMMGVAMASAALVLDWVADRLGLTLSPWEVLGRIGNRWIRWTASAILTMFLAVVATVSIYGVVATVPTREEAMKMLHNLDSDDDPIELDQEKIRRALLWYSICVTMGAALMTTSAVNEIRGLRLQRRWRMERDVLKSKMESAGEQLSSSLGELDVASTEHKTVDEAAANTAAFVRNNHLFDLERARTRKVKPKGTMEVISEALRGRANRGGMQWTVQ